MRSSGYGDLGYGELGYVGYGVRGIRGGALVKIQSRSLTATSMIAGFGVRGNSLG
jgi:hypothetical protein